MKRGLCAFIVVWGCAVTASAACVPAVQTQANVMADIAFQATAKHEDPFNDVRLDVVFTDPAGRQNRVPAFWAGKNVWKVRYASPILGRHTFRTECVPTADDGLNGVTGEVEIKAYTGHNPLFANGTLRVAADRRHLEYAGGAPFFWMADTWWMGLCNRLHWPDEFKTLTADRVGKGFNVIQIVAGLYPDMPPFDPRGANEAGFPWEPGFTRIRPEYFDAADDRLGHLVDSGLTPCIVGAWGYFLPLMGVEKAEKHWRYLVARYGAWPVVWCVAGEANLPYYLAKGFPYDDREQVKGWTQVTQYLRKTDPFHRLITIHPTGLGRLSARHAIDDVSLLDIDMLQTPHGRENAVAPTLRTVRESYADRPVLPVIDGEASYEMLGDNLPTEWTRRMFWLCMMNGAAGHTYGANGIWQCNRRGQPHGASPHGGNYGSIPWDDAMKLPGSTQVGLGKRLLEEFTWQKFEPHPEWATYASGLQLSLKDSRWIWFPEGKPAEDAPAEKRFFRRTFVLPEGNDVRNARLRLSADDRFAARLNGTPVGTSPAGEADAWRTAREFDGVTRLLKTGSNVLAIEAENLPARGANPAGLIVALEVQFDTGEPLRIVSDETWKSSKTAPPGWDTGGFDDSSWSSVAIVAPYRGGPWGDFDQDRQDDLLGPQSAGIRRGVRVIYVPKSRAIAVHDLERHHTYHASYFDPVSGSRSESSDSKPDDAGSWTCPAPAKLDHDWVLILTPEVQPTTHSSESPSAR